MQETNNSTQTLVESNIVQETLLPLSRTLLSSECELDFSQEDMAHIIGTSQQDYIPSHQPTLNSVATSQSDFLTPPLISLEALGLQHSSQIAALNNSNAPAIVAYVTSTMQLYQDSTQDQSNGSCFTLSST